MRIQRSVLAVPASDWKKIQKAVASTADGVFIDLEDSVSPGMKAESRSSVIRAMTELDWGNRPRAYRVNGLDTPYFYRDVIDVVEACGSSVEMIVVPKVHRAEDVVTIDTLLAQIEMNLGCDRGSIALQAQIESAVGLVNAVAIARASPRVQGLVFGPGDFAASMRMPVRSIGSMDGWDAQYPGHRFHYAMAHIVVAARAAGLQVTDGPVADFRDQDALRRGCTVARALGYDGKWCIHPGQIEIVNEAFSPTPEELRWAHKIVDAYEKAHISESGAIDVDNVMVDAASATIARTVIELAQSIRVGRQSTSSHGDEDA